MYVWRGPNCSLLKSLYTSCCLIRLLTFMLDNVYLLFGKALAMDSFFFFFFKTVYFRLQGVSLEDQNR